MFFRDLLNSFLFDYDWQMIVDFIIRVVVATVCGAMVGVERTKRFKEAGIRTHCVVAAASAVFMILSKYAFADMAGDILGTEGADGARIASQVVSGISFLGAGAIFRNGNMVRGLTTAAGIWATAAIGMSVGSGMYFLGVFLTILILGVQVLMHKFRIGYDTMESIQITFVAKNTPEFRADLKQKLTEWNTLLDEYASEHLSNGEVRYTYAIKLGKQVGEEELFEFFETRPDVHSFGMRKN
ncbi:MAG: MgtC/SapB family protein [Clostridia bacterium]|nr:MgtC/SapB family protein [Clostridia bacterium]